MAETEPPHISIHLMMIREREASLPYGRTWLLAIGRHLKADYDATTEPVPPRLAALVKQLEMPSTAGSSQKETGRPAASSNSDAGTVSKRARDDDL
jgi:hypothetical protein